MSLEWNKSPLIGAIVGTLAIIFLISLFSRTTPEDAEKKIEKHLFAGRLQEAVGYGAAKEAAKTLGETGGEIVQAGRGG